MSKYVVTTTFGKFRFEGDFVQAASPIWSLPDRDGEDEDGFPTPFQVADASHRPYKAALLLLEYFGRDYWCDPDLLTDEDEEGNETFDGMTQDEYLASLIESVEEEDEEQCDTPEDWERIRGRRRRLDKQEEEEQ